MACSKIFTALILALVVKDKVLSCSLRVQNSSSQPLSSTTESTSIPGYKSAPNISSLTQNRDTLNKTANTTLIDSFHQNPVTPLFVPEPPVEPISTEENQILLQLLLQRLPTIPPYETVPIQSPFSQPISVYQPTSNFPDYIKHALLQQIYPSSTSLKPRYSNVETYDPELLNRMLPHPSSSAFINPITISNAVPTAEPIITLEDNTTFISDSPTSPTIESISATTQEFLNASTLNTVLNNSDASTQLT